MSYGEPDTMMIDAIGIPEYFITEIGRIEEAGGGCLRVYNCIKRAGHLVPVFSVIIPRDALVVCGLAAVAAAREIIKPQLISISH